MLNAWCSVTVMELVEIDVVGIMNELVVIVVEALGENQVSTGSGTSLSEFTGSSEGSAMSKPPTTDMSSIIHPIKYPIDDVIEQRIDKLREWYVGLMLHCTVIDHVQFGKQKLGEDEEVGQ